MIFQLNTVTWAQIILPVLVNSIEKRNKVNEYVKISACMFYFR